MMFDRIFTNAEARERRATLGPDAYRRCGGAKCKGMVRARVLCQSRFRRIDCARPVRFPDGATARPKP